MKKFKLTRDGWGFWKLRRKYWIFTSWFTSCESLNFYVVELYLEQVKGEIA